jgi:uridylate kinase
MSQLKILSVGGSIIIPKTGFDITFLKKFRQLILGEIKKGHKFVLVIGGGATCRTYQNALENTVPVTHVDLDQLGIASTYFNAEFIRLLFKDVAYTEVVKNPTVKIKTAKPVIVAGGWKPGCSTDKDAVLFAQNFKTREIYNLSNVEYIYTADPQVDPTAQKLEQVTWEELQKIVGTTWKPGLSAPFDPMATKLAKKLKLIVRFVKGSDLEAVKNVPNGKKWQGTSIE